MPGKDIKLLTHKEGFEMVSQNVNLVLPPNNEILYDDLGNPSVMVKIPQFTYEDVGLSGKGVHPAFIVDGKEVPYIYISKYLNIVENGRAYSLPYQQPRNNIALDEAKAFCEAKGKGWHLMSNAEWAAIALWSKKNECMPYGNNNNEYGDYYKPSEKGTPMRWIKYYNPDNPEEGYDLVDFTATGSGPKSWFHNNDFSGIADLNGNAEEWVSGIRFNQGELLVIPNNDSAMGVDESDASPLWKAICEVSGEYINPGTPEIGTVTFGEYGIIANTSFKDVTTNYNKSVPEIVKALALFPNDAADTYREDFYAVDAIGNYRCSRGGTCYDGNRAGVFSLSSNISNGDLCKGFRSAFVELPTE